MGFQHRVRILTCRRLFPTISHNPILFAFYTVCIKLFIISVSNLFALNFASSFGCTVLFFLLWYCLVVACDCTFSMVENENSSGKSDFYEHFIKQTSSTNRCHATRKKSKGNFFNRFHWDTCKTNTHTKLQHHSGNILWAKFVKVRLIFRTLTIYM